MTERNFRTLYYKKAGIDGVEEKKSLEILLKEKPLDVVKLRQFCLRFQVPAVYRIYLWKIILGVIPNHQESHEFVYKQRCQQYEDLYHALKVMRKVDETTDPGELYMMMYRLQTGTLTFQDRREENGLDSEYQGLFHIGSAMNSIVMDNQVDAYWLTIKFYALFKSCGNVLHELFNRTLQQLKKEDTDQKLVVHLEKHDVFSHAFMKDWFKKCFANVLPETSIERIWDKIISGSCTILVFVAVSIFLTLKRPLLSMKNKDEMITYLSKIPEDSGDVIVLQAIDLWQKSGGHLVQQKTSSPIFVDRSPS